MVHLNNICIITWKYMHLTKEKYVYKNPKQTSASGFFFYNFQQCKMKIHQFFSKGFAQTL